MSEIPETCLGCTHLKRIAGKYEWEFICKHPRSRHEGLRAGKQYTELMTGIKFCKLNRQDEWNKIPAEAKERHGAG